MSATSLLTDLLLDLPIALLPVHFTQSNLHKAQIWSCQYLAQSLFLMEYQWNILRIKSKFLFIWGLPNLAPFPSASFIHSFVHVFIWSINVHWVPTLWGTGPSPGDNPYPEMSQVFNNQFLEPHSLSLPLPQPFPPLSIPFPQLISILPSYS